MRPGSWLVGLLAAVVLLLPTVSDVAREEPEVPAPSEGALRLAFAADAQESGKRPELRALAARLDAHGARVLIYGGDTTHGYADAPPDWLEALGPYRDPARMRFVFGTHDGGPGYAPYVPSDDEDDTYWMERLGAAVVVALDTNYGLDDADDPQVVWLERALAAHEPDLLVLVMHVAWWVPGSYHRPEDRFPGDGARFDALVRTHGVDLVLAAHEHYYARETRGGVPHVVVGPAETAVREVPVEVARRAEVARSVATALLLDVTPCGILATTLDGDGRVIDAFEAPALRGEATVRDTGDGRVCRAGEAMPQPQGDDAAGTVVGGDRQPRGLRGFADRSMPHPGVAAVLAALAVAAGGRRR